MVPTYSVALLLSLYSLSLATPFGLESNGTGYNETLARNFASLAALAYCTNLSTITNWKCGPCQDSNTELVPGKIKIINEVSTQIIIGKLKEQSGCLISFRGSNNLRNWISNLHAEKTRPTNYSSCKGCKVHAGFQYIWKTAKKPVMAALNDVGCTTDGDNSAVYITGHSLGAALSHLAMFTLSENGWNIKKTYTFEAPRVGNKKFAKAFAEQFTRNFPVFRITHHKDPVPHLPPKDFGFYHVKTEVYYNKTWGYRVCDSGEDKSCADQFSDIPGMIAFDVSEHCASELTPTGSICAPENC